MKNKYLILIILTITTSHLLSQSLTLVDKFGRNPGMLKMFMHIPVNLDASKEVPLVLVLHGCTQTAKSIGAASGWNKLADSLGFIVLYPEQRMINNTSKCFNFFVGLKAKRNKGEAASIKNMITYTSNEFNIDRSRVFITGMSAGGGMSNVMLNAYPEIFNAGALLESPPILPGGPNESSKIIPRIAIVQGDEDKITSPQMGEKLLDQWVKKNKMDSTDFKLVNNFMDNNLLRTRSFYNSKNELRIVMLNIKNTGHKLLIDPGENIKHGGRSGVHTKDINFHSTYWVAEFFGLTN